ncbi:exodeoxyribonuclease V subunit alpha [Marinomonas epiphytica]
MDFSKQENALVMMNPEAKAELSFTEHGLSAWQELGILRAIDQQWIEQLAAHCQEKSASVLVAGALLSRALGDGHICLDLEQVWRSGAEYLPAQTLQQVLRASGVNGVSQWQAELTNSSLVSSSGALLETPMVLADSRLYLFRYYSYEQIVLNYLTNKLSAPSYPVDKAALQMLFDGPSETGVDWQKVAVANAASLAFSVISGGPGTGKTTTVTKLLALLVMQAQQPIRIALAAPTGKAAARLTESITQAKAKLKVSDQVKAMIPEQASTLHRLLGSRFGRSRFIHDHNNPLHIDVLLVDEVSMVDLPMMAKLIAALPPHGRLIFLGDKDQLASVEAGSILGDITHGIDTSYYGPEWANFLETLSGEGVAQFANPHAPSISRLLTLLRVSYRFASDSGIGQLAKAMNQGDVQGVMVSLSSGAKDVTWQPVKEDQTKANIAELAKGYDDYWNVVRALASVEECHQAFAEYQILTAVRQGEFGVERINTQLEQHFYQQGKIQDLHTWYPGKAVMLTRNDKNIGLFNGDIGLCFADDQQRLRVWFQMSDGTYQGLLPSRLSAYETVFAMTVHKSQGSEFSKVALVLPNQPSAVLTKELIYTGVTRAKHHFTLWGRQDIIQQACQNRVQRSSGLAQVLWPNGA